MQKTKKSVAKRFKLSGTGKAIRRSSNLRHGMISDNRNSKRKKGSNVVVAQADQARVRKMLGS